MQSGNVIFRTDERNMAKLCSLLQNGIQRDFKFRPDVIVRTTAEMRDLIARNPFAARRGLDPSRMLVTFLANAPAAEARKKLLGIKIAPEEMQIDGREIYAYYPNGIARPKLSWPVIERALKTFGTGRNWNSVTKIMAIAEKMESLV